MSNLPPDETPNYEDVRLADLARLRQGCYRFFGASFLYPDEQRLENLKSAAEELLDLCACLAGAQFLEPWRQMLMVLQGLVEGDLKVLEGEYVRLFLVRPMAPPLESFHVDPERRATGWIVAHISREYLSWELGPSPSLRESPDHVSVELEFMAFLCSLEANARGKEGSTEGLEILKAQMAFLDDHLGCWFPSFAQQVAIADRMGVYTSVAKTAAPFIHHDRQLVALLLARYTANEGVSSEGHR